MIHNERMSRPKSFEQKRRSADCHATKATAPGEDVDLNQARVTPELLLLAAHSLTLLIPARTFARCLNSSRHSSRLAISLKRLQS